MQTTNTQRQTSKGHFHSIGGKLAQFIGSRGINNAQRALLLTDSRAFMQLMLGEMVIAGWLHGKADGHGAAVWNTIN